MESTFVINLEIYPKDLLLDAINDFGDVSKISLSNDKLTIFGESEEENAHIFNEFMNYVIGLINQ